MKNKKITVLLPLFLGKENGGGEGKSEARVEGSSLPRSQVVSAACIPTAPMLAQPAQGHRVPKRQAEVRHSLWHRGWLVGVSGPRQAFHVFVSEIASNTFHMLSHKINFQNRD